VSPVTYELRFYIPEDGILHSHRRENLEVYTENTLFQKLDLLRCSSKERGTRDLLCPLDTERLDWKLALSKG
jgi:hypothetical protein